MKEKEQEQEAEREKENFSGSLSRAQAGSSPSAVRRPPVTELPSAVRRPPVTELPSVVRRPSVTQLRWRCRRGMRELDVLLERYMERRYACASADEQQAFESLLDLPDPQLFAYLVRREPPADSGWVDVIAKLTAFDP